MSKTLNKITTIRKTYFGYIATSNDETRGWGISRHSKMWCLWPMKWRDSSKEWVEACRVGYYPEFKSLVEAKEWAINNPMENMNK